MSAQVENNHLWEKRGKSFFRYNGESYYTITPIPFYLKRREILLNLAKNTISKGNINHICDFGCGDGWYISYFKNIFSSKKFTGIDISSSMLEKAKEKCPDVSFLKSDKCIKGMESFDAVITFAVLAHIIDDKALSNVLMSINSCLACNGILIIFEQVAPESYSGQTFKRRSIAEYKNILSDAGFVFQTSTLIDFPAHRFFERHIAKFWYKHISGGNNDFEKRIDANANCFFRMLSWIFLKMTFNPVVENAESGWGNVFMVFQKK